MTDANSETTVTVNDVQTSIPVAQQLLPARFSETSVALPATIAVGGVLHTSGSGGDGVYFAAPLPSCPATP